MPDMYSHVIIALLLIKVFREIKPKSSLIVGSLLPDFYKLLLPVLWLNLVDTRDLPLVFTLEGRLGHSLLGIVGLSLLIGSFYKNKNASLFLFLGGLLHVFLDSLFEAHRCKVSFGVVDEQRGGLCSSQSSFSVSGRE